MSSLPGATRTGDYMESFLSALVAAIAALLAARHAPKIRILTDNLCAVRGDAK
jgi:hypothetical protein